MKLKHVLLISFAAMLSAAFAADDISSMEFLARLRQAPSMETWAKMSGSASHKRSGAKLITAPIQLSVRFTPSRIIAQLIFNGKETYNLGQTFQPPVSTRELLVNDPDHTDLALYGISPEDLTLGFIYKTMVREESKESVKGQSCRVFLMNADNQEYARIFVSEEYLFPLKVHWFKKLPASGDKPYRELELGGIKKKKDYWLISELKLFGPDWRTKITFDKQDAGAVSDGVPSDLFKTVSDL